MTRESEELALAVKYLFAEYPPGDEAAYEAERQRRLAVYRAAMEAYQPKTIDTRAAMTKFLQTHQHDSWEGIERVSTGEDDDK